MATNTILTPECCLRHMHQKSQCQQCLDICPEQAITLSGNMPLIDPLKCSDCGACIHVCPMAVLENAALSDTQIRSQMHDTSELVVFACQYVQNPEDNSIIVPCIARLDLSFFLDPNMLRKKNIRILRAECHLCHLATLQTLMEKTFNDVRTILQLSKVSTVFEIMYQRDSINPKRHYDEERKKQGLIRRRFFTNLLTRKESTSTQQNSQNLETLSKTDRYLQKHRRYLSTIDFLFKEHCQTPFADIPIGSKPKILDDQCRHCTICTHVCPTGALSLSPNDQHSILFRARACIECHLCRDICFAKAITFETKNLSDLLHDEAEIFDQKDFQKQAIDSSKKIAVYRT